jgi:hypothetical protein
LRPNRNLARRAASNLLTLAARRGRPDEFGFAGRVYDTIGFIESVERMRGAGLTLAPTAMASMNNQWPSNQPISDLSACASAFHVWLHQTPNCVSRSRPLPDRCCGDMIPPSEDDLVEARAQAAD